MFYSTSYSSPIGQLTLASDGTSLTGLWVEGQKYFARTAPDSMTPNDNLKLFVNTRKWLDRYFAGKRPSHSALPLAPVDTPFRQSVWQILCTIPYGEVATYSSIARQIASQMGRTTMSSQAVGGAVGHNPITIIIPCHRVVGTNGSLTGFASGIARKIKLLELEGIDTTNFYTPKSGTAL